MRRQDLEHGAVAQDRGLGIRELDLDQLRRAIREIGAVLRTRREQRALVDGVEQLGPQLLLGVDPIEVTERDGIAGIVVEHGGEVADRLVDVVELGLVDRRRGVAQALACLEIRGQLDLALERDDHLARISGIAIEPLEGIECSEVCVVDREHVLVCGDRVRLVLEDLLVERGDAMQQHETHASVLGEIGTALDDLDELCDAAFEREQPIERGKREQIVGASVVDLAPRVDQRA